METTPTSGKLMEVAGHQRVSRASIVGLNVCFLAERFMVGSRVAARPRDERKRAGPGSAREVRALVSRVRYSPVQSRAAFVTGSFRNPPKGQCRYVPKRGKPTDVGSVGLPCRSARSQRRMLTGKAYKNS